MTGEFVARRHGWDSPSLIMSSTQMLDEATEVLVAQPMVTPIPFYPSITTGDGSSSSSTSDDSTPIWWAEPGILHLRFTQSDDVLIELLMQDLPPDAADQTDWEWRSQIRTTFSKDSPLVAEFQTASEFIPGTPASTPPVPDMTQVSMFLPRKDNTQIGTFCWDLQSYSPFTAEQQAMFPDAVVADLVCRTWVRGLVKIDPQVTYYGALDADAGTGTMTMQTFFVGPNGRVP